MIWMVEHPQKLVQLYDKGTRKEGLPFHGLRHLLAGCLLSISDGISAYAIKDNNEHGNIVDGLIAALQKYREEMIQCGVISTK